MTIRPAPPEIVMADRLLQADLYMYEVAYVDEHDSRVPAHQVTKNDAGELVLNDDVASYRRSARQRQQYELRRAIECADTLAEWTMLVDALNDKEGVEVPERFRGECAA